MLSGVINRAYKNEGEELVVEERVLALDHPPSGLSEELNWPRVSAVEMKDLFLTRPEPKLRARIFFSLFFFLLRCFLFSLFYIFLSSLFLSLSVSLLPFISFFSRFSFFLSFFLFCSFFSLFFFTLRS